MTDWIKTVIKSCSTLEQLQSSRNLIDNYRINFDCKLENLLDLYNVYNRKLKEYEQTRFA